MSVRKFSFLLFSFSLIAGVLGAVIGEWLLASYYGVWPNLLLMGVYFGQLAFIAGLFYLLAELISPSINGRSWRLEYSGLSWKMLVPATLGIFLVAGTLFQFLYSLNFSNVKPPDDIVLVLDISDSMNKTDPDRNSLTAAEKLIKSMENNHRAAVISFNHDAFVTKEMFPVSDKSEVKDAVKQIDELEYNGQTDIALALNTALQQINDQHVKGRKPMVILFSDGYSDLDLNEVIEPYEKQDIIINTIGMSQIDRGGARLLKAIATGTGGSFYDVKKANELTNVFEKIYLENQDRLLNGERYGVFANSTYLAILRVILFSLIGGLFGLGIGIVFDNRYLAKSFALTGIFAGLLAGLVLEVGLKNGLFPSFGLRLVADLLITALTALGTLFIPIKEKFSGNTAAPRSIDSIRGRNDREIGRKSF